MADIDGAIDHYLHTADADIASDFIDALEDAFRSIQAAPAIGSPRYGHELELSGLRTRQLRGFPYLVFYIENEVSIDVWRVLHAKRDMAPWLQNFDT